MTQNSDDEDRAYRLIEEGNFSEALPLLEDLGKRDSNYAYLCLGWMHESGKVCDIDKELAKKYYRKSISLGSEDALIQLSRLLIASDDLNEAVSVLEQGVERGQVECMAKLGSLLVQQSEDDARFNYGIRLLQNAAAEGNIFAQRSLLGLEFAKADTISKKLAIGREIAKLSIEGARRKTWPDK